jgi:hypothetical protein
MATLASLDEAWPSANPRELGFQFRGYRLNPAGVPAFRTTWKDLQFTDTLEPLPNTPDFGLKRTLNLESAAPIRGVWLRIAAGRITEEQDGFVCDGVKYVVTGGLPIVRQAQGRQELLVQLPDGASAAKVIVEIRW